jgi:uncharacterized membrane protein YfcA
MRNLLRRSDPFWGPVLVGLLAGFLSGMFGVGGGILIVPGLVLLLGMEQRLAHSTSLAAALPISAAAIIGFAIAGEVDWLAAIPIIIGASVGAVFGTSWLWRLPVRALRFSFAAVLVVSAARLLIHIPTAGGRAPLTPLTILGLVVLGLLSGMLAGLLGVGGGIVIVPALVILWGSTTVVAKGTSLAVIVFTAMVGTARNLRHGNVDIRTALLVGFAGSLSALGGAAVSLHIGAELSDDLFAILLLGVALRMLFMEKGGQNREVLPEIAAEP